MGKKSTLKKRPETDFQLSQPALIDFYLPTQNTIGFVIFRDGIYSTSIYTAFIYVIWNLYDLGLDPNLLGMASYMDGIAIL